MPPTKSLGVPTASPHEPKARNTSRGTRGTDSWCCHNPYPRIFGDISGERSPTLGARRTIHSCPRRETMQPRACGSPRGAFPVTRRNALHEATKPRVIKPRPRPPNAAVRRVLRPLPGSSSATTRGAHQAPTRVRWRGKPIALTSCPVARGPANNTHPCRTYGNTGENLDTGEPGRSNGLWPRAPVAA